VIPGSDTTIANDNALARSGGFQPGDP